MKISYNYSRRRGGDLEIAELSAAVWAECAGDVSCFEGNASTSGDIERGECDPDCSLAVGVGDAPYRERGLLLGV